MKLEYITFYCLPQFFISKGDFKMNLKTKTNTVKQILAKVMLVILLLTSVLSLSGCEWTNYFSTTTMDNISHIHDEVESKFKYFDNYQKLEEFINTNTDTYEYVTFNIENQYAYLLESYEVYTLCRLWNGEPLYYFMDYLVIRGNIEFNEVVSDNKIVISFASIPPSKYKNLIVYEDTILDIKVLDDKIEDYEIDYCMYYGVYAGENKLMEFSIKSTSQKLSEEEFSEICDDLKQYLVIIE